MFAFYKMNISFKYVSTFSKAYGSFSAKTLMTKCCVALLNSQNWITELTCLDNKVSLMFKNVILDRVEEEQEIKSRLIFVPIK
jgi:hypothetical protein